MRKIYLIALTGMALITQPVSVLAQGQGNQGQGNQGQGNQGQGNQGQTKGPQAERVLEAPSNRNNGASNRPSERAASPAQSGREQVRNAQAVLDRAARDVARQAVPEQARRASERIIRTVEGGRYSGLVQGIEGCPPGLEKKDNGCLPPGQARKLANSDERATRWYRYSDWYRVGTDSDWRYDNGYAYLVDGRTNLITSALPLLGGALFGGNSWPANFLESQLSPYQARYFGYDPALEYRQANGAIFAVDPENQMIQSIVGFVTGDNWSAGSRMPAGYDAYNVPYDYRDRYPDTSSSLYRYNDGYVYEVDPTTQIIRSLIELVV